MVSTPMCFTVHTLWQPRGVDARARCRHGAVFVISVEHGGGVRRFVEIGVHGEVAQVAGLRADVLQLTHRVWSTFRAHRNDLSEVPHSVELMVRFGLVLAREALFPARPRRPLRTTRQPRARRVRNSRQKRPTALGCSSAGASSPPTSDQTMPSMSTSPTSVDQTDDGIGFLAHSLTTSRRYLEELDEVTPRHPRRTLWSTGGGLGEAVFVNSVIGCGWS